MMVIIYNLSIAAYLFEKFPLPFLRCSSSFLVLKKMEKKQSFPFLSLDLFAT